ncbi:MAG: hypothetical protein Q9188_001300 [Gyalolechia gomerana]
MTEVSPKFAPFFGMRHEKPMKNHAEHAPSGFLHLGAGLSVGLTGLAAGYAIGIVGDVSRVAGNACASWLLPTAKGLVPLAAQRLSRGRPSFRTVSLRDRFLDCFSLFRRFFFHSMVDDTIEPLGVNPTPHPFFPAANED